MAARNALDRVQIAVVSDDAGVRKALRTELLAHGFDVTAVPSVDDLPAGVHLDVVVIDASRSLRAAVASASGARSATGACVLLVSEHVDRTLDWGVRVVPYDPAVAALASEITLLASRGGNR